MSLHHSHSISFLLLLLLLFQIQSALSQQAKYRKTQTFNLFSLHIYIRSDLIPTRTHAHTHSHELFPIWLSSLMLFDVKQLIRNCCTFSIHHTPDKLPRFQLNTRYGINKMLNCSCLRMCLRARVCVCVHVKLICIFQLYAVRLLLSYKIWIGSH